MTPSSPSRWWRRCSSGSGSRNESSGRETRLQLLDPVQHHVAQTDVPREVRMRIGRAGVAFATGALLSASLAGQQSAHNKQAVTFKSGQLTLAGVVYKPDGPGPFPIVVWNHGSEKMPGSSRQFDAVADIFVPA